MRPFAFRVVVEINNANIHIAHLPDGVQVHSPKDALQNQRIIV